MLTLLDSCVWIERFADAIILAHARLAGVELVTCDRHFEGLEGVVFTPKAPLASGD